jgi:hypothetical protein
MRGVCGDGGPDVSIATEFVTLSQFCLTALE